MQSVHTFLKVQCGKVSWIHRLDTKSLKFSSSWGLLFTRCILISTLSAICTVCFTVLTETIIISKVSNIQMACFTELTETVYVFQRCLLFTRCVLLCSRSVYLIQRCRLFTWCVLPSSQRLSTYFNGVLYLHGVFYCAQGDCLLIPTVSTL